MGGIGFGTVTRISPSRQETLQPYGIGVGARLGYTFEEKLYLGATIVFHKGEELNTEFTSGAQINSLKLETRIWYAGAELGYWSVIHDSYAIRLFLNLGIADREGNFSAEGAQSNDVSTVTTGLRPYASPGLGLITKLTTSFFVGIDARYIAVVDYQRTNAFAVFVSVGITLDNSP